MNRIPTLDGWRGIAILLVLFEHTQVCLLGRYLRPWAQTGQHGVTVFFVLSGFLITSRLLDDSIDLKRFYIRRFFRLMPTAWAYLAAMLLFELFCGQRLVTARELASCVFFYRNFLGPQISIAVGHFWSLSMEEQFYLAWPCVLFFAGGKTAKWVAALGSLACAAYRYGHWGYYNRQWLSFQTEVRADALLIGCLFALLLREPQFRTAAEKWSKLWTLPAFAILLFCIATHHWLPPLYECLAVGALITSSTLRPQSIFARPLSFPPLVWLGTVSYSLYVWQQFFFLQRPTPIAIVMMCIMPFFALAAYYCIERPATRLGHRLTRPPARASLSQQPAIAHQAG